MRGPGNRIRKESLAPAGTEEYFRRLRRRLQVGLLMAFLVPLMLLSSYFHFQFNRTLKESSKLHLTALAESQRNTIDLFLQERVVNIFNLFRRGDFTLSPSPDDMRRYLQQLREMSEAFVDVGLFGLSGRHIGYAGPYPYLQEKDYSREVWFRTLMDQDQDYYISDIYLGFRRKLHFTIAVKQVSDGKPYVLRAVLDPHPFSLFLRTLNRGKSVDVALINQQGRYQIVAPGRGELAGDSGYLPPRPNGSGANEVGAHGDTELVAYAWLREVPWVLVVRQPLRIAYATMYRVRRIMMGGTAILVVLLIAVIWWATCRLVRRMQSAEKSRAELQSQLIHAGKLAAVGELAAGVAHEINNPLAIISSESGLIRDMLDPQFGLECTPEAIQEELDHIDEAVFRARNVTQKLLSLVRQDEPRLEPVNLNQLLDDVLNGLKEKEFQVSNIQLVRDYAPNLPDLVTDRDQLYQVFLNLINNAGDAIQGPGTITLTTRCNGAWIQGTVTDTGQGMTPEQMEKVFHPFHTTKEVGKGTGLGLSISLSIIQNMGGRIEVQSAPGAGSSFSVVLPLG